VQRVLAGKLDTGFHTPGGYYGADFILEVEGVKRRDGEDSASSE
jgi:hypothetical protein